METVTILFFMVLAIYSITVYFINPVIRLLIRYVRSSDNTYTCLECGFVSDGSYSLGYPCPECGTYPRRKG